MRWIILIMQYNKGMNSKMQCFILLSEDKEQKRSKKKMDDLFELLIG